MKVKHKCNKLTINVLNRSVTQHKHSLTRSLASRFRFVVKNKKQNKQRKEKKTRRDETRRNETERNGTKRNETKRNKRKQTNKSHAIFRCLYSYWQLSFGQFLEVISFLQCVHLFLFSLFSFDFNFVFVFVEVISAFLTLFAFFCFLYLFFTLFLFIDMRNLTLHK